MISYSDDSADVSLGQLKGFFVGWSSPPSPSTHLEILKNSDYVVLAFDEDSKEVVGFITAISDNVLSAHIPLLEVQPAYQKQGIGRALVERLLRRLSHLYMVDVMCDPNIQPFYEKLGMKKANGMMIRNYAFQAGCNNGSSA